MTSGSIDLYDYAEDILENTGYIFVQKENCYVFRDEQKYINYFDAAAETDCGILKEKNMDNLQEKYLTETRLRIQYEGFTVCEEKDGLLPVEWADSPICNVNGNGGMIYDPEQIRKKGLEDALDRVREIVGDTLTYMRRMETAPPLVADGLSGDYRLQDGTLWQGHYFNVGEGMDAAKRDFTVRSGLIPATLLFTRAQLAVIFDAAQNMTTLDLVSNPEQGKLLEGIMKQIEEAVPQVIDLANELTQYPQQHKSGEMQLY